jgi:ribosomal subunit interface protein
MQQPIQITFRDMGHSDAAEAYVRDHAAKLEQFDQNIVACKVALEMPHRHRRAGQARVRIDLTVPSDEIVVDYSPTAENGEEGLYAAIDQAFDRAIRQLEDYVQRRRWDVKRHESAYREGHVVKLWSYEGFGFIETAEGDEVYFHRNSVLHHGFDRLAVGSRVRFVEEMGERGPQASTVVGHD